MKLPESLKRRWVIWVWQRTPNCAEMSYWSSQRLDRKLPFKTRLKMRLHLLICVWCERYRGQLEQMHRHAPAADEHLVAHARHGLSAEAKERMVQRLRGTDAP